VYNFSIIINHKTNNKHLAKLIIIIGSTVLGGPWPS